MKELLRKVGKNKARTQPSDSGSVTSSVTSSIMDKLKHGIKRSGKEDSQTSGAAVVATSVSTSPARERRGSGSLFKIHVPWKKSDKEENKESLVVNDKGTTEAT